MSIIYQDSAISQSAGISLTGTGGVSDKQVARAFVNVDINGTALGLVTVNLKWKNRAGTNRTKQVLSLPLLTAGSFSVQEILYFWDTGASSGVSFQWEVLTTGTGFSYDVAVGLEDLFIGN